MVHSAQVVSFSTFACPEVDESGQIVVSTEDETNFDMDRFKRESSTAPLTLVPTPSVTSYPMFNSAPYGSCSALPPGSCSPGKLSPRLERAPHAADAQPTTLKVPTAAQSTTQDTATSVEDSAANARKLTTAAAEQSHRERFL